MGEQLQEADKRQGEMRQEQFKLRRELTSSIPMEAPVTATNKSSSSRLYADDRVDVTPAARKGASLLNPRVKKVKKSGGSGPFASDSGSGGED